MRTELCTLATSTAIALSQRVACTLMIHCSQRDNKHGLTRTGASNNRCHGPRGKPYQYCPSLRHHPVSFFPATSCILPLQLYFVCSRISVPPPWLDYIVCPFSVSVYVYRVRASVSFSHHSGPFSPSCLCWCKLANACTADGYLLQSRPLPLRQPIAPLHRHHCYGQHKATIRRAGHYFVV